MASSRRLEQRFAFASRAIHRHRRHRGPDLAVLEGRVVLSMFTFNSVGDSPTGIGSNDSGDLQYCINQANADNQANTIVFDSTVFSTPQTITLGGGQLELSDTGGTQTITGPAAGVTISGGGTSRVFQVDDGVTASLSGLTISHSPNSYNIEKHKKVIVIGTMTISGCIVTGNSAFDGAGFYNASATSTAQTAVISNSVFSENGPIGWAYWGPFTSGGRNSFS